MAQESYPGADRLGAMAMEEAEAIAKERFSRMAPTRQIKFMVSGVLIHAGKVLLGKRSDDDASLPGVWCTPGGGVNFHEDMVVALKREFVEEVGLIVEPLHSQPFVVQRIHEGAFGKKHAIGLFWRVQRSKPCSVVVGPEFSKVEVFDKKGLIQLMMVGPERPGGITDLTVQALKHFSIL